MNTKPMLKAQNIRRSLTLGTHSLHILQELTFQVERGEWAALTGPSGSGKSTLPGAGGLNAAINPLKGVTCEVTIGTRSF